VEMIRKVDLAKKICYNYKNNMFCGGSYGKI